MLSGLGQTFVHNLHHCLHFYHHHCLSSQLYNPRGYIHSAIIHNSQVFPCKCPIILINKILPPCQLFILKIMQHIILGSSLCLCLYTRLGVLSVRYILNFSYNIQHKIINDVMSESVHRQVNQSNYQVANCGNSITIIIRNWLVMKTIAKLLL